MRAPQIDARQTPSSPFVCCVVIIRDFQKVVGESTNQCSKLIASGFMNRRRTTTVLSANVDTRQTVTDLAVLSSLRRLRHTPSRDLIGSLAERSGRPAERAWRLAINRLNLAILMAPLVQVRVGVAFDVCLYDHIDGAADHDEMLDIVAPHEHQSAPAIDIGLIHDIQPLVGFRSKKTASELN